MLWEILAEEWRRSGVQEGDTLLVHSRLRRLFKNSSQKKVGDFPPFIFARSPNIF